MALDLLAIRTVLINHALASGIFDSVSAYEPVRVPGDGLTAAVWADSVGVVRSSGLASASARVVFNVRLFTPMRSTPQDDIDPRLTAAVDALMTAYAGDLELGALAREIDFFGSDGPGVSAQAGHVVHDDKPLRIYDLRVPVIVNDVWPFAA